MKMLNVARINEVEEYLYYSPDEFMPDPSEYRLQKAEKKRQYEAERKKVRKQGTRAFGIIRSMFKHNSQAESVIKEADGPGRLDLLWKLFIQH
jgi:hypothetical protein